jgi:hypothetical protein
MMRKAIRFVVLLGLATLVHARDMTPVSMRFYAEAGVKLTSP